MQRLGVMAANVTLVLAYPANLPMPASHVILLQPFSIHTVGHHGGPLTHCTGCCGGPRKGIAVGEGEEDGRGRGMSEGGGGGLVERGRGGDGDTAERNQQIAQSAECRENVQKTIITADGDIRSSNNNNNRRLVTLAEHTSDHGKQTNSSTKEKGNPE